MRPTLWLKGRPRCQVGDVYENGDIHGPYIACLQCGYYLSSAEELLLRRSGLYQLKASQKLALVEDEAAIAMAA